jgi:hypothetical protein
LQQSSKKLLSQHPVIRRLLSGLVLVIFAFSITPKKLLHDLVANHRDKNVAASFSNIIKISTDGFLCKCDNLVAESPFTETAQAIEVLKAPSFAIQESTVPSRFYIATHFFFSLRGPPAVV